VDYQNIVCLGDSQTFGARSYGCYPLYLVSILNKNTRYSWSASNLSTNGHTVRDLWFRLSTDLPLLRDVYQACILIGANDVGRHSPLDLFEEYYRQVLLTLRLKGLLAVYCGEIPPIWADGHAFFRAESASSRDRYNERLRNAVGGSSIARLVTFPELTRECYTDPVHLNETGNECIARAFANVIMNS
jgi:lysophospholipase L1-like esterase